MALASFNMTALAQTYWGLRNMDYSWPDSLYQSLGAKLFALAQVGWNKIQPTSAKNYNWSFLDFQIDFVKRMNGVPVVLVGIQSSWASEPSLYGGVTPPLDLDRTTPLTAPIPQKGYSTALYDFVYELVKHLNQVYSGTVYFRMVNEPSGPGHWDINLSDSTQWASKVEDYERCLRTFYKAAHDAESSTGLQVRVSHGGIMPIYPVEKNWFALGQNQPQLQDSLLALFNSLDERYWQIFSSWNDVVQYITNDTLRLYKQLWFNAFIRLTNWVDYQDIHYHFKPRFLADNIKAYETVLHDSGIVSKPWLAAEATMRINQRRLPFDQRFHAADMVRKWVLGMDSKLIGICTAIIGSPPTSYFGLYDSSGNSYLAATSYRFLSSLIPNPLTIQKLDSMGIFHFRFSGPNFVDIVWKDALFDTTSTDTIFTTGFPSGYDVCKVVDVLGNTIDSIVASGPITLQLTQEPRILIWRYTTSVNGQENIIPSFVLHQNYPNPFNPTTTIRFSLPQRSHVTLKVFDVLGREVATLVDRELSAGEHAVVFDAKALSSGVYFYRLQAGNFVEQKKMVVVK